MTKKLFALAIAFVLIVLPCACKENPVVEEKTVSAKQEILVRLYNNTNGNEWIRGCYRTQKLSLLRRIKRK